MYDREGEGGRLGDLIEENGLADEKVGVVVVGDVTDLFRIRLERATIDSS